MRLTLTLAAVMALAAIPAAAAAQSGGSADLAQIDREVAAFTGAAIGTTGGARAPVDRRMRLARCAAAHQLSPYGIRQDSVAVQCPGSWRIFVPLSRGTEASGGADLVGRGDRVSIVLEGRGFSVTQSGEAMEAGGEGDWIRIKPPGASEPIRAKVVSPGRVTIPAG
ncbi:MAG: flagella basal body P-ring formation protein FlgA [Allopontixanthobacter sediminis]